MCDPASGKKAPNIERRRILAPRADAAACDPNRSTRYSWEGMIAKKAPNPTMNVPKVGANLAWQW